MVSMGLLYLDKEVKCLTCEVINLFTALLACRVRPAVSFRSNWSKELVEIDCTSYSV